MAQNSPLIAQDLLIANQSKGDLLYFDSNSWQRLPVGDSNTVLTVLNGIPTYQHLNLQESVTGYLPIEFGGTGRRSFKQGLIYARQDNVLDTLALGEESTVLTIKDNKISFTKIDSVLGKGTNGNLVVWGNDNTVTDTSINYSTNQIQFNVPSLKLNEALIFEQNNSLNIQYQTFTLTISSNGLSFNNLLSIDQNGNLNNVSVPSSLINGVLNTAQGGTGFNKYKPGDILYATSKNTLGTLSTKGYESYILSVQNGIPTWIPQPNTLEFKEGNITLVTSAKNDPPLKFISSPLINQSTNGAMEYSDSLYFTDNKKRHKIAYIDSDIDGTASMIRNILPINLGGTGVDLSNQSSGSLIVMQNTSQLGVLNTDDSMKFLCSNGKNQMPSWKYAITNIKSSPISGIIVTEVDANTPALWVDQSSEFNPTWLGLHTFSQLISDSIKTNSLNIAVKQSPPNPKDGDVWYDGNDLYMCKNGSTVSLTSQSQSTTPSNTQNKQMHYICLFSGINPQAKIKTLRVPLPYGNQYWQFARLDLFCEIPSTQGQIKVNVTCDGEYIIAQPLILNINQDSIYVDKFDRQTGKAGAMIQMTFDALYDSQTWSAWLLIESY